MEHSKYSGREVSHRFLTKQFTATLILLLQQDGKLNIQDPVGKYLPDAPKIWKKITLFNLLNHTSGIPDFTDAREFRTWRMIPHTPDDEIASFRNKPLEFEPGSKFSYSNSNYEVLGAVIERLGWKAYSEQLYERIFEPLGMHDTGLDRDDLVLPKRAQGYGPGYHGSHQPAQSQCPFHERPVPFTQPLETCCVGRKDFLVEKSLMGLR